MTEPPAGNDLAFWAALPAAARSRIATALRQEESQLNKGAEEREEGDGKDGDGIEATKEEEAKLRPRPLSLPASFRPPSRRGVSVVHHLVPAETAARAARELDEVLKRRGSPGGLVGAAGERGRGSSSNASLIRNDTACWLGESETSSSPPSPALTAVRTALLSLRAVLGQEWDISGRVSVMAASYLSGGRYARHADEKEEEEEEEEEEGEEGDEDKAGGGGDGEGASKSRPRRRERRQKRRRRTITAICYLDDAGRCQREEQEELEGGGGELVLYPWSSFPSSLSSSASFPQPRVVVPPSPGLCVCFDSSLQHEVLPLIRNRGPRRAVTVFFYSREEEEDEKEEGKEKATEAKTSTSTASTTTTTTATTANTSSTAASRARSELRITRPGNIFVSVPSFRDPETRWTLQSLFESADRPERVTAGVVWQVSPGGGSGEKNETGDNDDDDDEDLLKPVAARDPKQLALYHSRVRSARLPAADATGPCAARAIAASLWQGEEFYLSVDAHSRFARGWDTRLRETLFAAEGKEKEKNADSPFHPVLTSYPPCYEGEGPAARIPEEEESENGDYPFATLLCASHFGDEGFLRLVGKKWRWKKENISSRFTPIRSLFWAAGFSFSRAHFAVCPPTRYEDSASSHWTRGLFWGEEHDVLLRASRAGFRFWAPPPASTVVFTRYERSQVRGAPPVGARGSCGAAAAGKRLAAAFGGGRGRSDENDAENDTADETSLSFFSKAEVEARYGPNVAAVWRDDLGVDWKERTIEERVKRGGRGKGDEEEEVEFLDAEEKGKGFSVL